MNKKIFISLTHADKGIAEAIKEGLHALLPYQVEVVFSASKELDSGIKFGEDWVDWIRERVRTCDFVIALMTPTSVSKPWILWELGAVYGSALASNSEAQRKIRPLLCRVSEEHMPSPLRDTKIQLKRGDDRAEVVALFTDIVEGYKGDIPPELYRNAITLLESETRKSPEVISEEAEKSLKELKDSQAVISAYSRMVNAALDAAPAVVPPEEWHRGLFRNAPYPITGVLVLETKKADVAHATIQEASSSAESFYGFPPNGGALVGKKITDLFEMLKKWMDPDDFKSFVADQTANGELFAEGVLSAANVPIVFNNKHPKADLRGKSFLPVALHLSRRGGDSFMTILYLDLKGIPQQLKKRLPSQSRNVPYPSRPELLTEGAA